MFRLVIALGTVIVSSFAFTALTASAHVGYVLDDAEMTGRSGPDIAFLVAPLGDIKNILLILFSAAAAFAVWKLAHRTPHLAHLKAHIRARAEGYGIFVPWILRLSLGIALLGAGTSGALISPIGEASPLLARFELLFGFLLLAGLFTGISALGALIIYVVALAQTSYFLGGLDVLALGFGILALSDARPGADDLFGVPFFPTLSSLKKYVPEILRVGVGIGMMYLAVYEKLLNPHLAAAVVEKYHMTSLVPVSPALWVLGAGVTELIIGIMLVAGFRVRIVSAVAIGVLALSFFYFNESVYAHVTLFGILSSIVILGPGKARPAVTFLK